MTLPCLQVKEPQLFLQKTKAVYFLHDESPWALFNQKWWSDMTIEKFLLHMCGSTLLINIHKKQANKSISMRNGSIEDVMSLAQQSSIIK